MHRGVRNAVNQMKSVQYLYAPLRSNFEFESVSKGVRESGRKLSLDDGHHLSTLVDEFFDPRLFRPSTGWVTLPSQPEYCLCLERKCAI